MQTYEKVVTIDNTDARYVAGDDSNQMMEARKRMSDQEFVPVVKQHILAQ